MVPWQLEVIIRFFVGVSINGRYCDSLRTIGWVYVSSIRGFWFDAVTSIPLSWVDYVFYQARPRGRNPTSRLK